jgi:hypothetical protein
MTTACKSCNANPADGVDVAALLLSSMIGEHSLDISTSSEPLHVDRLLAVFFDLAVRRAADLDNFSNLRSFFDADDRIVRRP